MEENERIREYYEKLHNYYGYRGVTLNNYDMFAFEIGEKTDRVPNKVDKRDTCRKKKKLKLMKVVKTMNA